MKNLIKRIFALAVVVFVLFQIQSLTAQTLAPFPAKYSFVNGYDIQDSNKNISSINEIIIPSNEGQYSTAYLIFVPFEGLFHSLQSLGFGKNHLLMIFICLSAFFLILSHKNRFETDIYEFYNRNSSGEVIFESEEIAKTHEFKNYMAASLKFLGVISGLFALFILVI